MSHLQDIRHKYEVKEEEEEWKHFFGLFIVPVPLLLCSQL